MKVARSIFIVLLAVTASLLLFLSGKSGITAAQDDFNITVDVNISAITEITVSPSAINWTQLAVGAAATEKLLDIRNTGTVNITNLYSYISTLRDETARPYASSNPLSYSAGGVIVYHNESSPQFFWAGKVEWNWTEPINNIVLDDIDARSRVAYGFLRNATNSFVWAVGNGTGGLCNNSEALFAIESEPDDGYAPTRTPTTDGITRDAGDSEFSYFKITRSGHFLEDTCVAVNTTCTQMYFYKFDKRPGFKDCGRSNYMNPGPIVPGQIEKIGANVWLPKGMPAGDLKQATWTFYAD